MIVVLEVVASEVVKVTGGDTEIIDTLPASLLATYRFPFAGSKESPAGLDPTPIVPTTELVELSISETLFEPAFVTYRYPLVESKAIPNGALPTPIDPMTTPVSVLMMETLFDPWFTT